MWGERGGSTAGFLGSARAGFGPEPVGKEAGPGAQPFNRLLRSGPFMTGTGWSATSLTSEFSTTFVHIPSPRSSSQAYFVISIEQLWESDEPLVHLKLAQC